MKDDAEPGFASDEFAPASLDLPSAEFNALAADVLRTVSEWNAEIGHRAIGAILSPAEASAILGQDYPVSGVGVKEVLERIRGQVANAGLRSSDPTFFGWINSSGNQAAQLADILLSALNHYSGKWDASSAAAFLEQQTLGWVADFIGYSDFADGVVTSGGSSSTLLALAAARNRLLGSDQTASGLFDRPSLKVFCSAEAHSCIDKAADLLGIGRNNVRRIPVSADFTVDLPALRSALQEEKDQGCVPLAIVATAGTTNTGSVDNIEALADLSTEFGTWLHVDGSYGAAAAGVDIVRDMFAGLHRADSVAVNAHKWLYVPVEAGCLLLKDPDALRNSFSLMPPYLGRSFNDEDVIDVHERSYQLSKDLKVIKIWATLLAYGSTALKRAIRANIELMRHLAAAIEDIPYLQLMAPVPLSIVCFRALPDQSGWTEEDTDRLNSDIVAICQKRARVFVHTTRLRGLTVIRACSINHRLTPRHLDLLLHEISAARLIALSENEG